MGNTWEVYVWKQKVDEFEGNLRYDYVIVYAGESWVKALWSAIVAKKTCGYIKVEWR